MPGKVVFVYDPEGYHVYIGRGRCPQTNRLGGLIGDGDGKYGNRWSHKEGTLAEFKTDTVEEAVAKYREYALARNWLIKELKHQLMGLTLGCWCNSPKRKDKTRLPCHGDVLVEIANS